MNAFIIGLNLGSFAWVYKYELVGECVSRGMCIRGNDGRGNDDRGKDVVPFK